MLTGFCNIPWLVYDLSLWPTFTCVCVCVCRFDTYRSKDESRRLAQYVDEVETGQILAMVVNDEGSNNLEDLAKKALTKLGSQHFHRLGFRYYDPFPTLQ